MTTTHRARVEATLAEAAAQHAALLERLSPEMRASLPVDAQGLTGAIDFVAEAAGLSSAERRALVQPHAVNPAVMHARVFGGAPLRPGAHTVTFGGQGHLGTDFSQEITYRLVVTKR